VLALLTDIQKRKVFSTKRNRFFYELAGVGVLGEYLLSIRLLPLHFELFLIK
jgi:hypothetical protein